MKFIEIRQNIDETILSFYKLTSFQNTIFLAERWKPALVGIMCKLAHSSTTVTSEHWCHYQTINYFIVIIYCCFSIMEYPRKEGRLILCFCFVKKIFFYHSEFSLYCEALNYDYAFSMVFFINKCQYRLFSCTEIVNPAWKNVEDILSEQSWCG